MKINCIIRNVPHTGPNLLLTAALKEKGIRLRRRGRGARALPRPHYDRHGRVRYQGGEYQDLPMSKAPRFSAYYQTGVIPYPAQYFDFVGVDRNSGKIKLRVAA